MKFRGDQIPDHVVHNVVYSSQVDGDVVAVQSQILCGNRPLSTKGKNQKNKLKTKPRFILLLEVHNFVKEVLIKNKLEVFQHLLSENLVDHLPDLVYITCQHGHKKMTQIIMETGVRIITDDLGHKV